MSDISSLLNSLYANDQVASLEKTAEDSLIAALRDEGQVEENPYATMSDDELIAMLQGSEKTASVSHDDAPEFLEKVAGEMLMGQVMAHATIDELSLIKMATANGLCRVCKDSALDVQGSTICSGCAGADE